MFRLVFVLKNTEYAITNRRLLIRGGFWGISFKSVDYDRVQETDWNYPNANRPTQNQGYATQYTPRNK